MRPHNIKDVPCPVCHADEGERCTSDRADGRNWAWHVARGIKADTFHRNGGDDPSDKDDYWWLFEPYDPEAEERAEEEARQAWRDKIQSNTPEQLGVEWQWQCRRHDSAVDRCEEINSPTIEDAASKMKSIEREFERRGLNSFDYIIKQEANA